MGLAVFLLTFSLLGLGAYWASTINKPEDLNQTGTVDISEGNEVETIIGVAPVKLTGEKLVPTSCVVEGTTTDRVVFTFNVNWSGKGAAGAKGELTVEQVSIKIEGEDDEDGEDVKDLFTIEGLDGNKEIIAGTSLKSAFTLIFETEPENLERYNKVANQKVIVTLKFTVNPKNE